MYFPARVLLGPSAAFAQLLGTPLTLTGNGVLGHANPLFPSLLTTEDVVNKGSNSKRYYSPCTARIKPIRRCSSIAVALSERPIDC